MPSFGIIFRRIVFDIDFFLLIKRCPCHVQVKRLILTTSNLITKMYFFRSTYVAVKIQTRARALNGMHGMLLLYSWWWCSTSAFCWRKSKIINKAFHAFENFRIF